MGAKRRAGSARGAKRPKGIRNTIFASACFRAVPVVRQSLSKRSGRFVVRDAPQRVFSTSDFKSWNTIMHLCTVDVQAWNGTEENCADFQARCVYDDNWYNRGITRQRNPLFGTRRKDGADFQSLRRFVNWKVNHWVVTFLVWMKHTLLGITLM